MKKISLVAILLISVSNIFAFTTQGNWRWRKDNGSQTTATWLAAQNTVPVISSPTETLRIRIELYNDPVKPGGLLDNAQLEDSSDAPGARWDTVKVTGDANDPFVLAGSSPNVIDKEPTTQQLSAPHYTTFQAGKVIVSSEKLPASTVGDNSGTEYEWVIKPTANLVASRTYYFRVNAAEYKTGMSFPAVTTAATLPIKLSAFSATGEGSKVKLQWSTESEQNNDRFDVQRSVDGRTWETISSVKGKGTISSTSNYTTYDNSPLKGITYYRLQQYDINGKSTASDVKSFRLGAIKTLVSVSPNPARAGINFKFLNEGAKNVLAVLSDANGKVVYQQTFKEVQANALHKLNLQQPAPGIYILKLKGEGLLESIKVVVQ